MYRKAAVRPLEQVMNMCCCFFLAAGLLTCVYKLSPLEQAPLWPCWAGPLFTLALIALALNIRRTGLPLLILFAIILLYNIDAIPLWWETITSFIHWWQAGTKAGNPGFSIAYHTILHLLPAWALTMCLWRLLLRRPRFWLLFLCCLAPLTGMYIYGLRDFGMSLYLLTAGLLPWAAASAARRDSATRGWAAAFALPLTAFIIIATVLLLPGDTSSLRWAAWGDTVDDIRTQARDFYRAWQMRDAALESFDLREEYYERLGGPIEPDNTRMLTVKTKTPQLLKGSTYDAYVGNGWRKSNLYSVSIFNNIFLKARPKNTNLPLDSANYERQIEIMISNSAVENSPHPLTPFIQETEATVTLLHPAEPRLFYWGQPTDFTSKDDIEPQINENLELSSVTPLANGYTYTFSALSLNRNLPGFTEAMAQISPRLSMEELDKQFNLTDLQYSCMQLPTSLVISNEYAAYRKMLRNMMDEGLEEGQQRSLYEEAVLIERWLKENCRYTLTPEKPLAHQDFVLNFLYTREGYCTYYATAMVVLARTFGIPARYVTGYKLEPIAGLNRYEATNATAHAWAELYFANVGWLPFDATGQVDFTERRDGLLADMSERDFFGPDPTGWAGNISPGQWRLILWLVALILLLTLTLAWLWRRGRQAYNLPALENRLPYSAILELYYHTMLAQLSLLGWKRQQAETVLCFTRRMAGYLPEYAGQLASIGAAVSALRYGEQEPEHMDLAAAAALCAHFEYMLRKQLKSRLYFFYRLKQGLNTCRK